MPSTLCFSVGSVTTASPSALYLLYFRVLVADDYLVIGLSKPTKNKVDKAKELGVKIIEEKEWLKLSRNS